MSASETTVVCLSCGAANPESAHFCKDCSAWLTNAPRVDPTPSTASPVSVSGPIPSAPSFPPGSGVVQVIYHQAPITRDQDRTSTGLLLMVIGFALAWVPYINAIAGLLALIGIILVFLGRRGYDARHHQYVVVGGVLYAISFLGIVVLTLGLVASLASDLTASGPSSGGSSVGQALSGDLSTFFIGAVVLGAIGALANVMVVYGLSDRQTRWLLWAGFVSGIVTSVIVLLFVLPMMQAAIAQATSGSTIDPTPINNLRNTASLYGAVSVVSSLFFAWAYLRARREALSRS
ncbi:MAG: hypothetical protein KGI98_17290, partial [Euryarchaeota archaeon]|nr:hypothetical protein [Euryarchaeota archaeon]